MNKTFIIDKIKVKPGENKIIRLEVGHLPSDTLIHLSIHIFRSKNPGSTMLALAGVHGDEINGVELLRRTIADGMYQNLLAGSVIVIPVLNIFGFNNFSRELPDGKDVNRSFPGNSKGSLAARVANIISKKILPLVDFGIDFHTGGNSNYNYPQIRYSEGHAESRALGEIFAPPILIAKKTIPHSFRKTALDVKIPILTYEGGENLRFDGFAIEKGITGIRRVLQAKGMLAGEPTTEKVNHFTKSFWVRAVRSGLFQWMKCSGQWVVKGERLAIICDPYGQTEIPVLATQNGYIIGHNNAPVINSGEALFHIATM